MQLDQQQFHQSLERNHFATVPMSISRQALEAAADRFLSFLELPESLKRQLHFPARRYRATADGYTDRSDGASKDPKRFFHWTPFLEQDPTCVALRQQEAVIDRFFQVAEQVYQSAEATLKAIYTQCLPDYRERLFVGDHLIDGTLRFLCYALRTEQTLCAKAHYDKGFSTLALGDSAPGLRVGRRNAHPLFPVHHQGGHAIFMPAWMLFQASQGRIQPAWHDVLHPPGVRHVNRLCARWSIVFFVNDPQAQFSSWDSVHTPLHYALSRSTHIQPHFQSEVPHSPRSRHEGIPE